MPLQKGNVSVSFGQGLDGKTDPNQVSPGHFVSLQNSIFTKTGLLQKRNGFGLLSLLPDTSNRYLETFNGNVTAIGQSLNAFSAASMTWVNKGNIYPLSLETLPLIRSNTNQSQCDMAISSNGLICTVYTDVQPSGTTYNYVIADSVTGQNIIEPTIIPVATGVVHASPRVFLLGNYFVIVFDNVITATHHLQYIAIRVNAPTSVTANTNISSLYAATNVDDFDGIVINNTLFLAWAGTDMGGAVRMSTIDVNLRQSGQFVFSGHSCLRISVTGDDFNNTPQIYVSFWNGTNIYTFSVNQILVSIFSSTIVATSSVVLNIASAAVNGVCNVFYEDTNAYSYNANIATNLLYLAAITSSGSTSATPIVLKRGLGLASKGFVIGDVTYVLTAYDGKTVDTGVTTVAATQPTYFLLSDAGDIISKLAYANGSGYITLGLPSVTVISDSIAQISYLVKDLVQAVNKTQGAASSAGVYSQTGINLATFTFNAPDFSTGEIGQNLNFSGGLTWAYDGYLPVEQGFHLYPDSIKTTWSATGGSIVAKPDGATNTNAYFYQVTYEWSDNQGNVFRSAPSIPVGVTTSGALSTGKITLNIPTLRVTAKIANPVKIVIYRWSVAQQIYYQVTSIASPTLNNPDADSITFEDKLADASIIGNNILYTTGGVVENIGPPATDLITLFKSRLFLLDSEDRNLLWFSKQVIESTPVEMNDLFTIYVAPTTGSQGSTGPITALSSMDDKLLIFKENAIYYLTGTGPDNTGANNDFSDAVFITSTVGCANQASIVFMPQGLMFQSDKGIWLLGRDLSTSYVGAPVENFNQDLVLSALAIPGTNQVRFTLESGVTLLYDYFFGQWGTFYNIPAISSTLYQGKHTYLDSFGRVFQETPGLYLDGSDPVVMSFTTGWMNLAGLQGYERIYSLYLLGNYFSPHKLNIQIAYDFNPSPTQTSVITPDNFGPPYGGDGVYGGGQYYGGPANVENWRVFFERQKCESFQLTVTETFDPGQSVPAGAGLTLSGMNIVIGMKSNYPRLRASRSIG